MNKVFVLGIDGGTFTVLNEYIKRNPQGLYARWMQDGFVRTLNSTKPYFTAPAWTTFMTGLNPGEHGIYHWRARYKQHWECRPLLSTAHLANCSLWSYLQQEGARISISNFPMEYPAPPTAGRYICGTLAQEDAENTSWPKQLIGRVRESFPDYRFEMNKGISYLDRLDELRYHILTMGQEHAVAFDEFCDWQSADFAFHTVTATDRMQHFFWQCLDESGTSSVAIGEVKDANPIFESYRIGEALLEKVWSSGRFDSFLIVSDHGAGAVKDVLSCRRVASHPGPQRVR